MYKYIHTYTYTFINTYVHSQECLSSQNAHMQWILLLAHSQYLFLALFQPTKSTYLSSYLQQFSHSHMYLGYITLFSQNVRKASLGTLMSQANSHTSISSKHFQSTQVCSVPSPPLSLSLALALSRFLSLSFYGCFQALSRF